MSRIILLLAAFALLLLVATMTLGLSLGDYQADVRTYRALTARIGEAEQSYTSDSARLVELRAERAELETQLRYSEWHRLTGIATAIAVLLVNSIVVTYFIGTTRWCREVSDTYRLDPALAAESTALKRRAFPWAVLSATGVIVTVALGGLADPTATGKLDRDSSWATYHLAAAVTTVALAAICFYVLWTKVAENGLVIERIMAEVHRVQADRRAAVQADLAKQT